MSDHELLKDTSYTGVLDESQYSRANYPEKDMLESESICVESTQGFKSVRITTGQKTPHEIVVRISAKLMSRRDQVRQINEAIKLSSMAY
jgi:hypothetical protein